MILQKPLLDYMTLLSVKYMGRKWDNGLEYFLWNSIREGANLEGFELFELARLAARYQGWFVWDDETNAPKFLESFEWDILYAGEFGIPSGDTDEDEA